jgi:lysophospholipase L1-like esterase
MRTLLRLGCVLAVAGLACSRADSTREEAGAAVPPAAGAAVETPAAATVADDWPRIVFLGDSLTAGYGLPVEAAVPALVQDRLVASGYPGSSPQRRALMNCSCGG